METSDQQTKENYVTATLCMENNEDFSFYLRHWSFTTTEWKIIFSAVTELGKKVNFIKL